MKVLIIEDDINLAKATGFILMENEIEVEIKNDGKQGFEEAKKKEYDVIVLDVMLPGMDGYQIAKELRRSKINTPIIMLTAKDSVPAKIEGLDSGADDYMTKPFAPAELLAHLRALTRRKGEVVFETLDYLDLTLNLKSYDLTCDDKTIHLSYKEFKIIYLLMKNAGQVVTKQNLLSNVWGNESKAEDNNVEAYISFIRRKLKFLRSKARIDTLRKSGYRMVESV